MRSVLARLMVIGGVASAATAPAMAADLSAGMPLKAAASVAAWSWTGFYAGLHAGGARQANSLTTQVGPRTFEDAVTGSGWVLGGQAGYNHQLGALVLGLEAEASATGLDDANACLVGLTPLGTIGCSSRVAALATLTGRAGWAFDRVLVYVKGGGAYARDNFEMDRRAVGAGILTNTVDRFGWTVGAGVEHAIRPNLSVKLEYGFVGDAGGALVRQDIHVAKLGVNLLFGTPGLAATRD